MNQFQNQEDEEAYERSRNFVDSGTVVSSFFTFIFEILKTFLLVGFLAIIFRVFIVQPFIVDGSSMTPTLHDKDYLLIDKISYRFHEPERGDILVFRYPKDKRFNYIKRIIGLPGDKILISEKSITIFNKENLNGIVLHEDYILNPNGRSLNGQQKVLEVSIRDNQYFVLGDNREGSSDSRDWGLLTRSDIIGRSLIRLFPVSDLQVLAQPEY